jgi:hypothetical protein
MNLLRTVQQRPLLKTVDPGPLRGQPRGHSDHGNDFEKSPMIKRAAHRSFHPVPGIHARFLISCFGNQKLDILPRGSELK